MKWKFQARQIKFGSNHAMEISSKTHIIYTVQIKCNTIKSGSNGTYGYTMYLNPQKNCCIHLKKKARPNVATLKKYIYNTRHQHFEKFLVKMAI